MTPKERDRIIDERMAEFAVGLRESHGTPALCLGFGHDHNRGALIVCTTKSLSLEDLVLFTEGALVQLRRQLRRQGATGKPAGDG